MPTFTRQQKLSVPARFAFDWHKNPGALERLAPPWERVRVIERAGGMENGRVVLEVQRGPLRRRWVARHSDYIEGRQFRDEQVEGPFRSWSHTHRFDPIGPDTSLLVDSIQYELPLGSVGQALGGAYAARSLERLFTFRQARLADDLARHHAVAGEGALRVAVTGASGMIGSDLSSFLASGGHEVRPLVRAQPTDDKEIRWDPIRRTINPTALEGLDAVVHLSGKRLDSRWTEKRKKRIWDSRIDSTRFLAETLAGLERPPKTFIAASAIGYYGSRGEKVLTEGSSPGSGFLADLCQAWEDATLPAREAGIRVVSLRSGVVLTLKGTPLSRLVRPTKFGLGAVVGSGNQYLSWISLDDMVGAIHHLLFDDAVSGPVNVAAPHPVTNGEFTKTLASVLGRPTFLRVPASFVKVAFGEMGQQTILASQRVAPNVLRESGFQFLYPDLGSALHHEFGLAAAS